LITAGQAFQTIAQALPARAGPADLFARVSHKDGMIRNILIHNSTGADEAIRAKRRAADDG